MKIGEIIKAIRTERGLNQTQLAQMLNVGQTSVSNWELGTKSPNYENLRQICIIFDLPPDYVLGFSDSGTDAIINAQEKALLGYYRNLEEPQRLHLLLQLKNRYEDRNQK